MNIISPNCYCSNCVHKYGCNDYAMIVTIQNLAKKFLGYGDKNITILIRTENCKKRKVYKKNG